jgi:hypothetical protein
MYQQIIALLVIIFIISRVFWQLKKNQINNTEFLFWLLFWTIAALAVIFLKSIDAFIAKLGFTSSGIDFLQYLAVVLLFYLFFRMRIRLEKIERNITRIVRKSGLDEAASGNRNTGKKE